MRNLPIIFAFLFLPFFSYSSSICKGNWSNWTISIPCNDTCGMCGIETQVRTCLPAGCFCNENLGSRTVACGQGVCSYPKSSCCTVYTAKVINQTANCVLIPSSDLSFLGEEHGEHNFEEKPSVGRRFINFWKNLFY